MLSQNVLFVADLGFINQSAHPPGKTLAIHLADRFRKDGFATCDVENWRDCGWSIEVTAGDAHLQIALSPVEEPLGRAQVTCASRRGILARLFGAKAVDRSAELYDLACAVHGSLVDAACREIRWAIDAYPDEGESSSKPKRSL
jgi:hypothetical protein